MTHRPWLYFALGVTTVISIGAVTNQLVPLASGSSVAVGDAGITFPDGSFQTTAAPQDPRRMFYLTSTSHAGDAPDGTDGDGAGVCATGFHFASLWEILDVSSLRYDTNRGLDQADSGQGPPSNIGGWVRTGFSSEGSESSNSLGDGGLKNCDAWSSAASNRIGTLAGLNPCWQEEADCVGIDQFEFAVARWWWAGTDSCFDDYPVWCVEDYPGAGLTSRGG